MDSLVPRVIRAVSLAPVVMASIVLAACDGDPVIAPKLDQDTARECAPSGGDAGDAQSCGAGEICLEGRCYDACTEDADCGPSEMCSSGGACVLGTVMRDAGPGDPCDDVLCTAPQVCHPASGTCTACSERTVDALPGEPGSCAEDTPVCDIANGRCVVAAPTHCAPCNSDVECTDGATFTGTCTVRDVMGAHEQVCLMPCTDTCPLGLECTDGFCIPPVGVPCTNWRAAQRRDPCLSDGACAPLGAVSAVYPGSCEGEDASVDPPVNGVCLQPCGGTDDCFDAAAGQTCNGTGVELFCRVPPATP